jgi:hypothetical protein
MNTKGKSKSNNIINAIGSNNNNNNNNTALYKVNINFDEATESWRANKKHTGNGMYKYMCCGITKTGKKCNRQSLTNFDYCKMHMKNKL